MKISARLIELIETREPENWLNPPQPIYKATKTRLVFEIDGLVDFTELQRLVDLSNAGRPVEIEIGREVGGKCVYQRDADHGIRQRTAETSRVHFKR
jgi:hypothetical protein